MGGYSTLMCMLISNIPFIWTNYKALNVKMIMREKSERNWGKPWTSGWPGKEIRTPSIPNSKECWPLSSRVVGGNY